MSGVDSADVARSTRTFLRLGLCILGLVLVSGCPEPEPVGPPVRLEVGHGLEFTPIEAGTVLELHRGTQGGQHVYVSLRAWDMPVYRNTVELTLERVSDGRQLSADYEVKLRFDAPMGEGEPALLEGLLLVVRNPSDVIGQQVRLKASIESEDGHQGSDSRTATVDWAAE